MVEGVPTELNISFLNCTSVKFNSGENICGRGGHREAPCCVVISSAWNTASKKERSSQDPKSKQNSQTQEHSYTIH